MGKVNLGELIAQAAVSNLDTESREQIEYIDIDRIDSDTRNFYELSGVDELAANIQLCGLQQPIRVRDGEHGRVVIGQPWNCWPGRNQSGEVFPAFGNG